MTADGGPRLMLASPGARVVVVGSGTYAAGSSLPEVGSVAGTVTDLGRCLVERAGLDPAALTVVIDPAGPVEFGTALTEAARQATEVLVVYYLGHGLVDAGNDLHLATHATVDLNEGIPAHQALPYAALRQVVTRCTAPVIVIVMDCCFSGRATPAAREASRRLLEATPQGTYLLAAAGRDQAAWAPPDRRHTAFTGALISLLTGGDPTAPALLTLDDVYRCLARTLPEQGFPAPRRQATDHGDHQAVALNPAHPAATARPASRAAPADGQGAGQAVQEGGQFSPYRGLAAYGPQDAEYFFGRTELTRVLVDRVAAQVTSGGLLVAVAPVAEALDYARRPRVVVTSLDFPTVAYQWLAKAGRGVEVVVVESPDRITVPVAAIARAIDDRTSLVATSHVYFTSGAIQDIRAVAEAAHARGALCLVDAYQSVGQVPVDVRAAGVDFLVGGGLKWLLGGPGVAFLYARADLARRLEPGVAGWFGHKNQFAFDPRTLERHDDARRFELGTPALAAVHAQLGGLEYIEEIGVDAIHRVTAELTEDLVARARDLGLTPKVAAAPAERSAIVMIPARDPPAAVRALADAGIVADARPGHVRLSPFFYNVQEDHVRALERLAATLAH